MASPAACGINATQYFEGIDPETFAFGIDITHYRRIAVALKRTRKLMTQITQMAAAAAPLFAARVT